MDELCVGVMSIYHGLENLAVALILGCEETMQVLPV